MSSKKKASNSNNNSGIVIGHEVIFCAFRGLMVSDDSSFVREFVDSLKDNYGLLADGTMTAIAKEIEAYEYDPTKSSYSWRTLKFMFEGKCPIPLKERNDMTFIADEYTKEQILLYAFRYALGKHPDITSEISEELIKNYDNLSKDVRNAIAQEIQSYQYKYGLAGVECDNNSWNKVKWLFEESNRIEVK